MAAGDFSPDVQEVLRRLQTGDGGEGDPEGGEFGADTQEVLRRLQGEEPRDVGNLERVERFAEVLGTEFDPSTGLGFVPRARLAWLGDKFEERQAAFNQAFPEGTFTLIPNTKIEVFQTGPGAPLRVVDPAPRTPIRERRPGSAEPGLTGTPEIGVGLLEQLGQIVDLARRLGQDPGDIADIIPLFGLAGGEAGGSKLAGRAAGLVKGGALTGAGAAGVELLRQGAQSLAGTQRESGPEIGARVLGEGVIGGLGASAFEAAARATRALRKGGLFDVLPDSLRAQRAAQRFGLNDETPLTTFQIAKSGLIRTFGKRALRVTSEVVDYLVKQNRGILRRARNVVDPRARARLMREIQEGVERSANNLLSGFKRAVSDFTERDFADASRRMNELFTAWRRKSGREVSELYRVAEESLGRFEFDKSPVVAVANAVTAGKQRLSDPITRQVDTGLRDLNNNPITRDVTEREIKQIEEVNQDLFQLADDVRTIDFNAASPQQPDLSPFESVLGLRERATDLLARARDAGEGRLTDRARRFVQAIDQMLDNPVGIEPGQREVYDVARQAARKRFETLDSASLAALTRTNREGRPEVFLDQILASRTKNELGIIREVTGAEGQKIAREAFLTRLGSAPQNASATIRQASDDALAFLFPNEAERRVVRDSAEKLDDYFQLDRSARRNKVSKEIMRQLFAGSTDRAGVDSLRRIVDEAGGKDSPLGMAVRSAVVDFIVSDANRLIGNEIGGRFISPQIMDALLRRAGQKGILRLLKSQDVQVLKDAQFIARFTDVSKVDPGVSIDRAALAGQFEEGVMETITGSAEGPSQLLDAIRQYAVLDGVGRLVVNPRLQRVLIGRTGEQPAEIGAAETIRLAGAIAASLTNQLAQEGQVEQVRLPPDGDTILP